VQVRGVLTAEQQFKKALALQQTATDSRTTSSSARSNQSDALSRTSTPGSSTSMQRSMSESATFMPQPPMAQGGMNGSRHPSISRKNSVASASAQGITLSQSVKDAESDLYAKDNKLAAQKGQIDDLTRQLQEAKAELRIKTKHHDQATERLATAEREWESTRERARISELGCRQAEEQSGLLRKRVTELEKMANAESAVDAHRRDALDKQAEIAQLKQLIGTFEREMKVTAGLIHRNGWYSPYVTADLIRT
jgi:DNA repair exonuclease SbcCD ATPase subunit